MHESASTFVDNWSDLVARVLGDLDLDKLAFSTRALRRRRGVPDALALLRLAQVAKLTDASLNDRLHQSCEFLAAVAAAMLQAKTPGCCFRWPGRILRISDGSCVSKPGSKGTDWRVHAVYDLGAGGFSHFELTDKHGAEALDRGAAVPGEIRIGDRNYSSAKALRRYVESVGKTGAADYLVRLRWSSLRMRGSDGKKFDLANHRQNMPADKLTDDLVVWIEGAGAPMRTRIVIRRKSEEAAQAERQRLLSLARKKGKTLDPRSLLAAGFVVLATSLDAETYPADELLAMYRLRWQIELAFKRLKSLLNLDRLPARTEKGARSWIWAHLILAIATDDYSQGFLDSSPSGPARRPIQPVDLACPEDRHPAIARSSLGTHRHRMPQNRRRPLSPPAR